MIAKLIRGAVRQNRTRISLKNKAPGEVQLIREAVRTITEYNLHQAGVTYAQQGYLTSEGYIPAWKLDEHLLVDRLMREATKKPHG